MFKIAFSIYVPNPIVAQISETTSSPETTGLPTIQLHRFSMVNKSHQENLRYKGYSSDDKNISSSTKYVNSIIEDISTILYLITTRHDLDTITLILHQTFELPPFKRDYDSAFGKVADILKRYGIVENARNLRFRFILCMQEFFDSIPQDQWKTKDPAFIKESEEFSIIKFREWIIEQIT